MHILLYHFYSRTPNPVYQEIAANLRQLGHVVWLGSRNQNDDLEWHDGEQVVGTIPGPYQYASHSSRVVKLTKSFQMFMFMWRVRSFANRIAPDIFQANILNLGWLLPLLRTSKTKFMYDIRQINENVDRSFKQRVIEKRNLWLMKMCARFLYDHTFFCHVGAARKILGQNWANRSSVIPVGIDQQFLEQIHSLDADQATVNAEGDHHTTKSSSKVRFLYVGTLSRLRSLEKLIKAAKTVSVKSEQFQLDFVGPDTTDGYYQDLVAELALDKMVSVKPPVLYHEIPQLMSTYDIGLAYVPDRPTWHYQPTIKVLEYRALGLPIVSTDVASHHGVVEDEVNGLFVKDDVNSIAESMIRYIEDDDFRESCQSNAITMRDGTTWAEVAQMYLDVYREQQDEVSH